MKLFPFWARETGTIQVYGEAESISAWGGSNVSEEDARAKAREKLRLVQERIQNRTPRPADYEVEIREEIQTLGNDCSSPVIRFHDQQTGATGTKPLA